MVNEFDTSEYSTCSAMKNDATGSYTSFDGARFTIARADDNPSDVCTFCLSESISLYKYNPKWFSIQLQPGQDPIEGGVYVKSVRVLLQAGERYIDLDPTRAKVSLMKHQCVLRDSLNCISIHVQINGENVMENFKDDMIEITYVEEGVIFSTVHGVKVKFTSGRVKVDVAESYSEMVSLTIDRTAGCIIFGR